MIVKAKKVQATLEKTKNKIALETEHQTIEKPKVVPKDETPEQVQHKKKVVLDKIKNEKK